MYQKFDALVAFSTEKWKQANSRRLWTVDAEADIIKSQKQPLLLTPWTNLSSAGYAFRCIVVLNGPPALHVPGNQSSLHPTPPTPSSVLRNPLVPPLSRITVPELRHCSGLFGDLWILLPPTNFHGPLLPTVCCDWRPLLPLPILFAARSIKCLLPGRLDYLQVFEILETSPYREMCHIFIKI